MTISTMILMSMMMIDREMYIRIHRNNETECGKTINDLRGIIDDWVLTTTTSTTITSTK